MNEWRTTAQESFLEPIIVDNFAGGGGASTGIELATGRIVNIAINHDAAAILMHRTNHPHTEHLQASVWDVDPVEICRGRHVGLAWFSPDCKHFSKAKGAALVDRNIRGLAWIELRWAALVRPDLMITENVEEFLTWGPVRKGKPVKSKAGQTFTQWRQQLENLGYVVEWRILTAADYGAPTTRKRLVIIARCDGKPIVWPARTHAPADHPDTIAGKCKPWRSAAEIIDWSLPCPSIFASKAEIEAEYGLKAVRPLADNTLRRIIRGVDKFTIKSGKPFIVPVGYGERKGQAPRVHDADAPLPTVVSSVKHNVCEPLVAPITFSNTCNSVGAPANQPIHTVTSAGNQILSAAQLIQYHTEQTENVRAAGLNAPINTVDASNRYGLVAAQLAEYFGNAQGGLDIAKPCHTITAGGNREGLMTAGLVEYYGNGNPLDVREPMHTATSHDREALTTAIMQPFHAGGYHGKGNSPERPVNTITSSGAQTLVCSHVAEFKGQDAGQSANDPLRTITAGGGEFAAVCTTVARYERGADMHHWPEVRELLNRFCGYSLADGEVLLLSIGGRWYYIADIGLRMLSPRELYNAMGFPPDYKIETDYLGNPYPKSEQVARCGNAVCPPMAAAVVRANWQEVAVWDILTMAELERRVAV